MRKYKVAWIQSGNIYRLKFFTPEYAMELAINVLKHGHTLLYVEQ